MKPHLTPSESSWWVWLTAGLLLLGGLLASPACFQIALALALAQAVLFLVRDRTLSVRAQTRFAFAALIAIFLLTGLHWLFWLPVAGIAVRVIFSYCGMARMLTLLPWNRRGENLPRVSPPHVSIGLGGRRRPIEAQP